MKKAARQEASRKLVSLEGIPLQLIFLQRPNCLLSFLLVLFLLSFFFLLVFTKVLASIFLPKVLLKSTGWHLPAFSGATHHGYLINSLFSPAQISLLPFPKAAPPWVPEWGMDVKDSVWEG